MSECIDVIEIRKAANGYVICAWMRPWGQKRELHMIQGFKTYVVESDEPAAVGRVLERVLRERPITLETPIPPARELP